MRLDEKQSFSDIERMLLRRKSHQLMICAALCVTPFLTACDSTPKQSFSLQVGPEQLIRFTAESAFAHYFQLPGREDLLRIVIASYPMGCHDYVPPEPGEVFVTVTLRGKPGKALEPGDFEWNGVVSQEDEPEEGALPPADALPFVRLAKEARLLPAGGGLKLKKLERSSFGLVEGELMFRDGGDNQASTTALMGAFSLRLCHLALDPSRSKQQESK